ncbi:MAG: hypothetical protein R2698_08725 [Microthrixaceae bacterium]
MIVVLNRYEAQDPLHVANRARLVGDGLSVVTTEGLPEEMMGRVTAVLRHCAHCGRPLDECDGACRRPLDPERFCRRCGRRLYVAISPAGHSARCKVHGPVGTG